MSIDELWPVEIYDVNFQLNAMFNKNILAFNS